MEPRTVRARSRSSACRTAVAWVAVARSTANEHLKSAATAIGPESDRLRASAWRKARRKICLPKRLWYTKLVHRPATHVIQAAAASDRLWRAADLGVSAAAMSRMSREGTLERVVPGVYLGAKHSLHPLTEAAAWTVKHPDAVACLLTAAIHHDLTDAFAGGTWLYVPKGSSPPRSGVVLVHVIQTAPKYIDPAHDDANDIISLELHGVRLRMTGLDRTTLDLWRYPQRISAEHALEALRRRVRSDDFHVPTFARLARRLGVWAKVEPVVQGLMLR
jgi:hypothetical protein